MNKNKTIKYIRKVIEVFQEESLEILDVELVVQEPDEGGVQNISMNFKVTGWMIPLYNIVHSVEKTKTKFPKT
jgi:hypothetical protein